MIHDAFRALASTPRCRILNRLAGGPMTVTEIADQMNIGVPSISKHLAILKEAGLVQERKQGKFVIYSVASDNLMNALYGFLTPFCPDARKISAARKRASKTEEIS